MNERRFVAERAARWRELASLLDVAQRQGLGSLRGSDVRRLGALYRATATDLATARTIGCTEDTVRHVNRLCAVAHDVVYSARRRAQSGALVGVLLEIPGRIRATMAWHLAATGIAVAACAVAWFVFRAEPDLADRTFGPVFRQRAERAAATADEARRYLDMRGVFAPLLSWGIIANNVSVSYTLFGLSAVTVVLGCVALAVNGVMLGGGFAVFADAGVPGVLGTFIAAHGPLELAALFLAAGAGLRVGVSWVLPGRRSRTAAFQSASRDALPILLCTTAMLVVAGLIEGFISPTTLPAWIKIAVGATTGAAFAAWVRFGR